MANMARTEHTIDDEVWKIVNPGGNSGKILEFEDDRHSSERRLPKRPIVGLEKSMPDWGRLGGITLFVNQTPPVKVFSYYKPQRESHSSFNQAFLASCAKIEPDGHIYPPQLPGLLLFAMTELGWQVKPIVWLALGQAYLKQAGNKIRSLSGQLK